MWTFYVLQHSVTKELYFGFTGNIQKRIAQHNGGMQTATRRRNGEWILVYREEYRSEEDARLREERIKHHGSAKHELKKRIQHCLL
jgi:putative endonuclease